MRCYADENFPLPVTEALRRLGHDVLTTQESGQANAATPDAGVLDFAIARSWPTGSARTCGPSSSAAV